MEAKQPLLQGYGRRQCKLRSVEITEPGRIVILTCDRVSGVRAGNSDFKPSLSLTLSTHPSPSRNLLFDLHSGIFFYP
ncbi:MAG: hypothetical protein Kow00111_11790 [Thermincola ferriacetica]